MMRAAAVQLCRLALSLAVCWLTWTVFRMVVDQSGAVMVALAYGFGAFTVLGLVVRSPVRVIPDPSPPVLSDPYGTVEPHPEGAAMIEEPAPVIDRETRTGLRCPACGQQTRNQEYILANRELTAVLEGCTACRTGIYRDAPGPP